MGSIADEVFDASKQAKAPAKFLCRAPLDRPAVCIGFVSPAVGYGLFAARDIAKDEFIFHEAPLMTARFNEVFAADKTLMQGQVSAYRSALTTHHTVTTLAFPALAAQFGIPPAPYDQVAPVFSSPAEMGQNLVPGQGQFVGCSVTREQYNAYTAPLKPAPIPPAEPAARAACLEFFKHYAFQVQPNLGVPASSSSSSSSCAPAASTTTAATTATTTATREACVYLLASLINHCCTPAPPLPFLFTLPTGLTPTTSSSSNSTTTASTTSPSSSSTATATAATAATGTGTATEAAPKTADPKTADPKTAATAPATDGPNCTWRIGPSGLAHFVRPRHICVQARRAIRAGEQLTWDYGKRDKGFACECAVCRDRLLGGLGSVCAVL
ncbi:hypothetical protein NEMBOFW57_002220 [Staphylotrichum longicolle]|uniref:SET domain-containing protein n=1 Tax=Staphylotrichum longicolle TaxID=669026 RepID=A0AAD4I3E7_9PEZI|nr:hypothetical protein NEMBOFW57_002220 [Staphylotrichum longicolle]